jgi:5-methyltetrahydropteroyltriglutamate--homocysteine methyltransferase
MLSEAFCARLSGDFSPLRFVGGDKRVVPGLLSAKRIQEAVQYIPLERLSLSPQFGFAPMEEGRILLEEQQWEKIRFIKEITGTPCFFMCLFLIYS